MEVIEYNLEFTYLIENELLWADNLKLNKEWSIIRVKGLRTVQKSYQGRTPNYMPIQEYKIAIYHLNKWIYLNDGNGKTIVSSKDIINIPNLEIKNCIFTPNLAIFRFIFDFHSLLTLIQMNNIALIQEYKKLSLTSAQIQYKNCRINVYENILSYRGKEHNEFEELCKLLERLYKKEGKIIKNIYNKIDKTSTEPKNLHISLSYRTWYNAKRENQRQWPNISKVKTKNSIEFPINSGVYYSYPNKYIGLAKRTDFNIEKYIPKIYSKNHLENKNSLLYKYINNIEIEDKEENKIIKKDKIKGVEAQILDINKKRIKIMINNKWENNIGNILENVPALPYNYRQILHDYAAINKLKIGKIMDLTNIGIVDESKTITYPEYPKYINKNCMETKRLLTLKILENEEYSIVLK